MFKYVTVRYKVSSLGGCCSLRLLLLSQLEQLEPGQSGVARWVVNIILCSNNLLAEGIVHTPRLLPPGRLSLGPGSLGSPLGSALCWELAELRLRSWLEPLGLRCSRLGRAWRRGAGLELTEGLPLLRAKLLLLDGKVLLMNLKMALVCVLLVSSGPE